MFGFIKQILFLFFNVSKKYKFFILSFLIILNFFFEFIGIILLIPLARSAIDYNSTTLNYENKFFNFIQEKFISDSFLNTANEFTTIATILIIIFLFKFIFSIFYNHYLTKFIFDIQIKLGNKIFDIYTNKSHLNFIETHSAEKLRNINDNVNYFSISIIALSTFIAELIMFFALFVFLAFMNLKITFFTFFIIIFILISYLFIFKSKIDKWSNEANIKATQKIKNITEPFNSFKEILIYNAKNFFRKKFKQSNSEHLIPNKKFIFLTLNFRPFIEFFFVTFSILVIIYVINLNIQKDLILNNLILFIVILSRLIPSVNRISYNFQKIRFGKEPINSIYDLIKNEKEDNFSLEKENIEDIKFLKEIDLKDVSFAYDKDDDLIVKNLNLTIKKGELLGIYGDSGSGKTTFLEILSGFHYFSGKILVDKKEVDVKSYNWKNKICYIPQNFYLLDDTIKNNILFGLSDTKNDLEKIDKSIEYSQLKDFIRSLKYGIETFVGEAGVKLSGGQRQRIALARAFFRNPEIILLDEATNALDINNSNEIIECIKNFSPDITVVMVSHDKELLKKMNKIYHFREGKIIL